MSIIVKFSHDGIEGSAEYSEEDLCYHGKILGIDDLIMYEGKDIEELKEQFVIAVEDMGRE